MDPDSLPSADDAPGAFNYILSFLLVGLAWGFTTPFIRRAAVDFNKRNELKQQQQGGTSQSGGGWLKMKLRMIFWTVVNLLRTPAYLIPLVLNLTGSVWFFLLVGKHELSLTVPIINSTAFLFTVLGEWYVEKKVIEKETWLGMALVLGGIALCVSGNGS